MTVADLLSWVLKPTSNPLSLEELALEAVHSVEQEAAHLFTEAKTIVHQAEKDIEMAIPQVVSDAIARIEAALSANAGAQQTIDSLNAQIADLNSAAAQKDAQIADLTQQLSDVEAAINSVVPA